MKKKAKVEQEVESTEKKPISELCEVRHNNVLLKRDSAKRETRTAGGILIPESVNSRKEPPSTAKVMAIGPLVKGISVGDTVVVGSWSGTNVELNEEKYSIVEDDMIPMVFKG